MLYDRQISDLVQRFYDFELEEENRLRLGTGVEFDEANRLAIVGYYDRLLGDVRGALARNELSKATKLVDAMLAREGIDSSIDASVINPRHSVRQRKKGLDPAHLRLLQPNQITHGDASFSAATT